MSSLPKPLHHFGTLLRFCIVGLTLALYVGNAHAQSVKENYTKLQLMIPMRDGVKLYTAVYIPKGNSQKYPIMMNRTPYSVGPYTAEGFPGRLGPSLLFQQAGYIFAYQDVRGKFMSEGKFINMRPEKELHSDATEVDEATDTYDTIEYLINHVPNNNGKVGMWGISYPGFYAACGTIHSHPALKAVSPQAPIGDWFIADDFHHRGVLFLMDAFSFLGSFGQERPVPSANWAPSLTPGYPDAYSFYLGMGALKNANEKYYKHKVAFWDEMMEHDTYDDYWKARNLLPNLKGSHAAVLTVGGFFDAEDLHGALKVYRAIEKQNPGIENSIVMGPWPHGGWSSGPRDSYGDIHFGSNTGNFYRENIEFPFFESHLKGVSTTPVAEASIFFTGSNTWKQFSSWPPKETQKAAYFLGNNRSLSTMRPGGSSTPDVFVSDPANPVPYDNVKQGGRRSEYMIDDQSFATKRPDVLSYMTPVLEKDTTLVGSIQADIFLASTGTDTDLVVKLIDVYPNDGPDAQTNPAGKPMAGHEMLVRAEIMRTKFRKSFSKPTPLTPGAVEEVKFELQDVAHTFKRGHKIMVQVQGSWFPLGDRNPGKFMKISDANDSDFQSVTNSIYHTDKYPSSIQVGILPK